MMYVPWQQQQHWLLDGAAVLVQKKLCIQQDMEEQGFGEAHQSYPWLKYGESVMT
jgi:hypothetical protein